MRNKVGHIEANTACAYHCDLFANGLAPHNGIDITHHHGVIDAFNVGDSWLNACCNDNVIKALPLKVGRGDALTQSYIDVELIEHLAVITKRLVKLFLTGHTFSQIELTTNFI